MSEPIAPKRARSMPKPHPNQVRSACERCRRQKLRCSRQTTPSSADGHEETVQACVRCARLGFPCVSGSQRKVGRPSRREALVTATTAVPQQHQQASSMLNEEDPGTSTSSATLTTATPSSTLFDSLDEDLLFPSAANTTGEFQWNTSNGDSVFDLLDIDLLNPSTSSDSNSLILHHQNAVSSTFERTKSPLCFPISASTAQFASLSKINIDLHSIWTTFSNADATPGRLTIESLVEGFCCPKIVEDGSTFSVNALLAMLSTLQEYLVTVKELHRGFGLVDASHDASASPPATSLTEQHKQQPQCEPSLDSPTAFLVISCFHQIVRTLELVFTTVNTCLSPELAATTVAFPPPRDVTFAGVDILEFSSQGVMYAELVRHVLRQLFVILGLPQADAPHARTMWTGLLSKGRYMDLLNAELGGGKDCTEWTPRPAKLLESLDTCKEMFIQRSMAGYN